MSNHARRELTGAHPSRASASTPAPTEHRLSDASSTSSSSSSSSSSRPRDWMQTGSSVSVNTAVSGANSAGPTTGLTSPASSEPVSPFASPVPVALDAHTLASAEEGKLPYHSHHAATGNGLAINGAGAAGRGGYAKMSDVTDEDGRYARKLAQQHHQGNGFGQAGETGKGEWDELLGQARQAGKAWRRTWEKEGWNGVVAKLRRTRLPSLTSARRSLTSSSSRLPPIRSLVSVIPPRRRITVLVTFALISLLLLFSRSSHGPPGHGLIRRGRYTSARKTHDLLQLRTRELVPAGYPPSANIAKVVESVSNPYGFMSLIDPYSGNVFNPSVLSLPDAAGAGWQYLLVARGEEKFEVIEGEDTRWESVVGCFLLPLKRAYLGLPYLARESELTTLNLPAQRKVEYLRCHNPTFDQFIGPEDPRLFFTNDGQPLLIYSQTGRMPNVCRALFIIDARMVIPGLDKALKRAGYNPPVVFREQTDLIREGSTNIEKNWSPMLGENDELFFHVSLVPQQIYKYVPNLTLRPLDPLAPSHNCLTDILGPDMNRVHLHHATPLIRATMCKRGECVPDVHNTVLFGIIHVKYHPLPYLHYVRHVVTWNVTSPYEYLSVSKPLTYSGTNQADPIFTVSMAWQSPSDRHGLGLNHGFLDDTVLISFGVGDYGSAYTDVLAYDLLTDHQLCAGIGGTSLWPRRHTSPA
ncbi:hypothetical protein OF846_003005 [Rhodotorula toruloides]|nr:hypothetical protein OF846_003005 [Rhodotorula toruloides]